MYESVKNKDAIDIIPCSLQVVVVPMPVKSLLGSMKRGPMMVMNDIIQLERKRPKNIRLWTVSNDPSDLNMAIARAEVEMKDIAPMTIVTQVKDDTSDMMC